MTFLCFVPAPLLLYYLPLMQSDIAPAELLQRPLWFYIKQNRRNFSLGMFFLLITNGLDAAYPLVIMRGIDQVVARAPYFDILMSALLFFGILVTLAATRYAWRTFFGAYHTDAAEDLRRRVFQHLTRLNPSFFQKNPTGELMSLLMNDVQAFRNGIGSSILVLVDGLIITAFIIPFMLYLNPAWTWKTLVFLPLVPFLIARVTKSLFANYKNQQERIAEWSGFAQESVAGVKVLKSFGLEELRTRDNNTASRKVEDASNRAAFVDAFFGPVMTFGTASGTIILLFIAGADVVSGAATVGTLVAFQRYIHKMTWPMTALGYGTSQYQKGMASFARIREIIRHEPEVKNTGTRQLERFDNLAVRDLGFAYGDRRVLEGISFTLARGQTLGVVGPVGCGKTTLLHLLCRFYPATTGTLAVNGAPIEEFDLHELRRNFTLVSQEPFLFSESIRSNLESGHHLAGESHLELLRQVELLEEIEALPLKTDSQLGERGVNLSGGQKQRLALARGMARSRGLILLDDVLSAVDSKTEKKLIQSLARGPSSRIIVSHRFSAVQACDLILVLNEGRQVDLGSHETLMSRCAYYRDMVRFQSEEPAEGAART